MKLALILLIVVLIALGPIALPQLCTADVATAAEPDGDDGDMEFWDWCVLWWTTHLDDWPK